MIDHAISEEEAVNFVINYCNLAEEESQRLKNIAGRAPVSQQPEWLLDVIALLDKTISIYKNHIRGSNLDLRTLQDGRIFDLIKNKLKGE